MNTKKLIGITIILFTTITTYSQQNQSLKDLMWERVNTCWSMFEDMDEDGKVDYSELIDDSKNGYLKVSGTFPTCGCSCTSIVGAYKDAKGVFTFLQTESWACEQTQRFSSNRSMDEILPDKFGLQWFIPNYTPSGKSERAVFYLKVEIPHYGTDTKLSLELIPFGINIISDNLIVYEYNTNDADFRYSIINNIISDMSEEQTLDFLLKGEYYKINSTDKNYFDQIIGEDYGQFKTMQDITDCLKEMYRAYELYGKIANKEMVLGWDKTKARFYVKQQMTKPLPVPFIIFLSDARYWGPAC